MRFASVAVPVSGSPGSPRAVQGPIRWRVCNRGWVIGVGYGMRSAGNFSGVASFVVTGPLFASLEDVAIVMPFVCISKCKVSRGSNRRVDFGRGLPLLAGAPVTAFERTLGELLRTSPSLALEVAE